MTDELQQGHPFQLDLLEKTFDTELESFSPTRLQSEISSLRDAETQLRELNGFRVRFTGKKSELGALKKMIGRYPVEQLKESGQKIQ